MPRDFDILAALAMTPLTAGQLQRFSETFPQPFTSERRVRERLQKLTGAGHVLRWHYATEGQGAPNYYGLSVQGFRIFQGSNAPLPGKRFFQPVGLANQHHTRRLADFIVHVAVCAHRAGMRLHGFCRENGLRLCHEGATWYPDAAFQLRTPTGANFSFFVELDNSSERVRSDKDLESWERKIRRYEALQDHTSKRFRVLIVTTRSHERLLHILQAAQELASNKQRSLFYGTFLPEFLKEPDGARTRCFLDHRGAQVALVPELRRKPPIPASPFAPQRATAALKSMVAGSPLSSV